MENYSLLCKTNNHHRHWHSSEQEVLYNIYFEKIQQLSWKINEMTEYKKIITEDNIKFV